MRTEQGKVHCPARPSFGSGTSLCMVVVISRGEDHQRAAHLPAISPHTKCHIMMRLSLLRQKTSLFIAFILTCSPLGNGSFKKVSFCWRAIPPSPPYALCVLPLSSRFNSFKKVSCFFVPSFSVRCASCPSEKIPPVDPPVLVQAMIESPLGSRPSLASSHWSLKTPFSVVFPPFLATLVGTRNEKDYRIPGEKILPLTADAASTQLRRQNIGLQMDLGAFFDSPQDTHSQTQKGGGHTCTVRMCIHSCSHKHTCMCSKTGLSCTHTLQDRGDFIAHACTYILTWGGVVAERERESVCV